MLQKKPQVVLICGFFDFKTCESYNNNKRLYKNLILLFLNIYN